MDHRYSKKERHHDVPFIFMFYYVSANSYGAGCNGITDSRSTTRPGTSARPKV